MWFQSNKCTLFEEFLFILSSSLIHHGHLHRVAYVSIWYRKWMNIKSIIKSTEFWWYMWWYCIYVWYSNFSKCIIQCKPWNIRLCHNCSKYVPPVRDEQVDIKAPNFEEINFHTYHEYVIQKAAIWTHNIKLFSESHSNSHDLSKAVESFKKLSP